MQVNSIIQNGVEDFADEGLEECFMNDFMTFLNKISPDKEASCATVAGVNAVVGVTRMTAMFISYRMAEAVANMIMKRGGMYWSYIYAGKIKKKLHDLAKNDKSKGRVLMKKVSFLLGADRTAERIEVTKLAQGELNRFDTHTLESQKIFSQNNQLLNSKMDTTLKIKDKKKQQAVELGRHKTMTSTWTNKSADKKLFESIIGQKISSTGQGSWAKQYKELNQLSDHAKDTEGNLLSHAQVMLMNMAFNRVNRM